MKKNLFILAIASLCVVMSVCCFATEITLEGEGTQQLPYIISNKQDFEYFAENYTEFSGKYVSLECDILLNDKGCFEFDENLRVTGVSTSNTPTLWTPIGTATKPFSAYFDGKGHMIFGLYCNADASGLFGYVNNAKISDLRVYTAYVSATNMGGILCASADGTTIISDVVTSGKVLKNNTNTMATRLGGIAGLIREDAIVRNSCSYADITMPEVYVSYAGGIAADNMGQITDCAYDGNITSITGGQVAYTGAIAGYTTGQVSRCTSKGSISAQSTGIQKETYVGGIAGAALGTSVSKCESAVSLSVTNDTVSNSLSVIGGIAAYSQNSSVSNCKATETILSNATYTGGIVGINNATNGQSIVSDCYNTANITAVKATAGGIVGANAADIYSTNKATLKNCLNIGTVNGVTRNAICGVEETGADAISQIQNCYDSVADASAGLTDTQIWSFSDSGVQMLYGTDLKFPATLAGLSDGGVVSADGGGYEYQAQGQGKAMYTSLDTDISVYGTHNAVVWFDGTNTVFASLPEYVSVYTVADAFETQVLSYDSTNNKLTVYIPSGIQECYVVIAEYESGQFKQAKLKYVDVTGKFEEVDYTQSQGISFKAFVVEATEEELESLKPLGSASWNQ